MSCLLNRPYFVRTKHSSVFLKGERERERERQKETERERKRERERERPL